MHINSDILFLKNDQLDKVRWDECITSSSASLVYARAFYLDNLCPHWGALIARDYNWVLPVTYNKKWGISYLYQPHFVQQLGLFAKANINPPLDIIIGWLKEHFKFWEINWNYLTDPKQIPNAISQTALTNFILELSGGYDTISAGYHKHLQRKLNRARQFDHKYQSSKNYEKYVDYYRKNYGFRTPHVKGADYEGLKKASHFAFQQNMVICREVVNVNSELIAAALLLIDHKRIYNLINITTETGKKTEANHFLLDAVIREFAGRELLFDFEGSDLAGVKTFYGYFGPTNQPYYRLKYNGLPWLAKLFKK